MVNHFPIHKRVKCLQFVPIPNHTTLKSWPMYLYALNVNISRGRFLQEGLLSQRFGYASFHRPCQVVLQNLWEVTCVPMISLVFFLFLYNSLPELGTILTFTDQANRNDEQIICNMQRLQDHYLRILPTFF